MGQDRYFRGIRIKEVTTLRLDSNEVEGYVYGIRHTDDCGMTPATVEKVVQVNRLGTLVLEDELDLGEEGFIILNEEDIEVILSII